MTTPRVTVPVEPTSEMLEAAENARMTMAGSDMSSSDMTRHIWSAMLSAAPAPEGGAVWNPHQITPNDIAAILDENADCSDEGGGLLNASQLAEKIWRAGLSALATREEALAEAGEIDLYDDKVQAGIAWTMRQWGEILGLKTWDMGDGSESVEGDVGAEIHTILVDAGLRDPETNEMAALRAQPQAREDAQPEYRCPKCGAQADERYDCCEVYTHPAPDALRVAELEATGLNWIVAKGRLSDDEPPYGCQIMDGEEVVAEGEDITLSGAIEIALSDIAALKAEQKGCA